MRNIILFILLLCSTSLFSKEVKDRLVLDKFELGLDDFNSIKNKVPTTELDIYQFKDNVMRLSYDNFRYKSNHCKIVLLLVDNKLYGVRYYPLSDRSYDKYINFLNKNYNICSKHNDNDYWFNSDIEIHYEMIVRAEWLDSFVLYDSELLKKYPQYRNF